MESRVQLLLEWETTGATEVTITDSNRGAVSGVDNQSSGAVEVASLEKDTLFVLVAKNSRGVSASAMATARVFEGAGELLFVATPSEVELGQPVTLAWSVPGGTGFTVTANDLAVELPAVKAQGTVEVFPTRDTTYKLSAGGRELTSAVRVHSALKSFTISSERPAESALLKYRREVGGTRNGQVELRLQDETEYRWKGRVDFMDNAMDRSSGTIRGRAVIANPDGFISPGMFGQMRLFDSAPFDALLLPDEAVVTDQTRHVVYVVDAAGTVSQKVVEPGRLVDGLRVLRSGLAPTDRVIISRRAARAPRPQGRRQGRRGHGFPVGRFARREQRAVLARDLTSRHPQARRPLVPCACRTSS